MIEVDISINNTHVGTVSIANVDTVGDIVTYRYSIYYDNGNIKRGIINVDRAKNTITPQFLLHLALQTVYK